MKAKMEIIRMANSFRKGYGVRINIGAQGFDLGYCSETEEEAKYYGNEILAVLDKLTSSAIKAYIKQDKLNKKIKQQ